jgi:4-amino-4-deoxy-L-arabinose transferase-like glycosyltransferase
MPVYVGVKPGHAAITAASTFLLGSVDYAGTFSMVLCSVGSVLLVYLIGKRHYDASVGLVAALLLSIDPFLTAHARTGKEIADAQLFFLLSFYFLFTPLKNPSRWRWVAAGLSSGLLLTINYVTAPAVALMLLTFLLVDSPWSSPGKLAAGLSVRAKSVAAFIASALIVTFIFVFLTYCASRIVPGLPIFLSGKGLPQREFSFSISSFQPLYYWHALQVSEGTVWVLLLLVSTLVVGWRVIRPKSAVMDSALIILAPGYLVILGLLSPMLLSVPRNALTVPPLAAIIIATAAVESFRWTRSRSLTALRRSMASTILVLAAVFAILGFAKSISLTRLHSGYKEAASWLQSHQGGRVDSIMAFPMIDFYLKDRSREYFSDNYDIDSLCSAFIRGDIRYLLVDWHGMDTGELLRLPEPVAVITNLVGNEPIYAIETPPNSLQVALKRASDIHAGEIRIYDLAELKCRKN